MFLLQDVEVKNEDPLATKESHIFYSKATPQLLDDLSSYNEQRTNAPKIKTKSVRLKVKLADSCRPKKQYEIKQKLDELMEKLDYALVFPPTQSSSERQVAHELFKTTFNSDFKEFKYISHKKFASMKEYTTAFVTVCTQSINTLKEVFHPMYEIHKTGKESEKIRLKHFFDDQHPPKHWVFAKLGRILTFEVPYSVVSKFYPDIIALQSSLRFYPHKCCPEGKNPCYKFYVYIGFNDPCGVQALTKLTNIVRPATMKELFREHIDKEQFNAFKIICEKFNQRDSKCEYFIKNISEEQLEIDFYSTDEAKVSREKFQEFQKNIRKLLRCDPKIKRKIMESFNLSIISQKDQDKDWGFVEVIEFLKGQPDKPDEEGVPEVDSELESASFLSVLNNSQSSKIKKAVNK